MFKTFVQIAFRGLIRNWRQSFAAIISIAASFVSLTLFQGYMDDAASMYMDLNVEREMMGHLILEKENKENMTLDEHQKVLALLSQFPEVMAKVRFLPITGQISNGRSSMVFVGHGHDVDEGIKMRGGVWSWNAFAGKPLSSDNSESLIMGKKLSYILGCDPQEIPDFVQGRGGYSPEERPMNCRRDSLQVNTVTVNGQMNSMILPIQGVTDVVYKELDERFVALPLETAQALMDTTDVGLISVRLHDKYNIDVFNEKLNSALVTSGLTSIKSVRWQKHVLGDLYNRTMDLLTIFRNFVISVILVISSLSVFNTLLRNISERQREIGTLRSIGYKPRHVRLLFSSEAFFLSVFGCVLGVILSLSLEFVINLLGLTYKPGVFSSPVPFSISVAPYLLVETSAFLIGLVIITSLFSVRNPLRKNITECLSHV